MLDEVEQMYEICDELMSTLGWRDVDLLGTGRREVVDLDAVDGESFGLSRSNTYYCNLELRRLTGMENVGDQGFYRLNLWKIHRNKDILPKSWFHYHRADENLMQAHRLDGPSRVFREKRQGDFQLNFDIEGRLTPVDEYLAHPDVQSRKVIKRYMNYLS